METKKRQCPSLAPVAEQPRLGKTNRTLHVRCYEEDLGLLEDIGDRLGLPIADAARMMMRCGVGVVLGKGIGEAAFFTENAWNEIARRRLDQARAEAVKAQAKK